MVNTNKVKTFTHLPTVEAQMAWTEKKIDSFLEFKLTTSGIVDLNWGPTDPESISKFPGNVKIDSGGWPISTLCWTGLGSLGWI